MAYLLSQVIDKSINAFSAQYGDSITSIIVDHGVELVNSILESILARHDLNQNQKIANLMIQSRKELALNQCNSFFAEPPNQN